MFAIFNILLISTISPQAWEPLHYKELIKYQHIIIEYDKIDSLASNHLINRQTDRELSHRIVGYLPYWQYSYYPTLDYSLLTEINYFSAELNEYGEIINSHNWENLELVEFAHNHGVKVKLCATLFGSESLDILLENELYRSNAINNLLNLVLLMNADGVDIDFELLPANQRENLVTFMQDLSNTFHESMDNPIITMATPAVDWSNAWDYNMLAQITDGLFIMGYDYFYGGSSTAGPVSPLGGYYYDLEFTVNDYIEKTNGQLDKLILGLPYYGYDWPVVSSSMNSETTGTATARVYGEVIDMVEIYGYNWNADSNAPWFPYSNTSWRQCWYDDATSLAQKYQFAKNNSLAGVGMWALGYDGNSNDLWDILYDNFIIQLEGDINGDGILNILDVVGVVNFVLNGVYSSSADLNHDEDVSILDIIILVNLILNQVRN